LFSLNTGNFKLQNEFAVEWDAWRVTKLVPRDTGHLSHFQPRIDLDASGC
jgi:hypothetical protein